ncbi:MAG: transposase [Bacillota bacterium]|nr:transposase [Bacillota bacterium]
MRERKNYPPEFKAKIVLESLREEKTISQIVSETRIHATVLSRWKAEALKRLPELFSKGESETEKMRKEFEAKEDEYMKAVGELTMDLNFLKKSGISIRSRREKRND